MKHTLQSDRTCRDSGRREAKPTVTPQQIHEAIELHRPVIAEALGTNQMEIANTNRMLNKVTVRLDTNSQMKPYLVKYLPFKDGHIPTPTALAVSNFASALFQDGDFKFVSVRVDHGRDVMSLFFVPKGQSSKLFLFFKHIKNTGTPMQPPILSGNIVEKVRQYTIDFFKANKRNGIKIGMILGGLPGNGKTMLCRWIEDQAHQNKIRCKTISAGDIISSFNEGELDREFNFNGFIFLDDVDISFFDRSGPRAELACALLAAMDGMSSNKTSVRIFTTNEKLEKMDPAFRRPGRIDKYFEIGKPTAIARAAIVARWKDSIINYLGDIDKFIKDTDGMSGAELVSIHNWIQTEMSLGNKLEPLDYIIEECKSIEMRKSRMGFS